INQLITKNLFTTITNANFDPEMITSQIEKTLQIKKVLLLQLKKPEKLPEAARWSAAPSEFAAKAATVGVLSAKDEDIRSLRELISYGLK
ncbi:hydroxylamine reductase, partial [Megasphaera massiliensis]|nr:hydroxylamine reductase [Megasphaera massiliensis]